MKTQRRHELQTNQLADRIGVYLQKVRPYQKQVLYGVLGVAVLGAAVLYLTSQQQAKAGVSWQEYFKAMVEQRPDALEEVARQQSGTTAALWARQAAGDMELATGASLLYRDRKEAQKSLKDAEKQFLAVEQDGARYPMLLQRARYGLAQVYESLCAVDKARDYYKKVSSAEPDSALGQLAQRRHDQIAGQETERWFAWFEKQEPKPPAGEVPAAGREPLTPPDMGVLPEQPDLSFPASDVSKELKTKPAAEPESKPAPEPATKPAAEPEPKAAPEPADASKPAEPKAETPPPAEAKPAEAASKPSEPAPPAEQPKP
jgi:tetratricopeptide (TPR) repeat protein